MDKAGLRARMAELRASRPDTDAEAGAAIAERAVPFLPSSPSDVSCFVSLPGEPSTGPLIAALKAKGHRMWLPRVEGGALRWVHVDDSTEYRTGAFGIREPVGAGVDDLALMSVVLMPAVAVDSAGRRLGRGRGYFDRALAPIAPLAEGGPMLVALVHDDEVVDEVPIEDHDHLVDAVITPLRVLRTGRTGRPS